MRAAGLRQPVHGPDRPVRGQPRPPGQPGPQLRQGPGHRQPGPRPRADPAPAEAGRGAGRGPLAADHLGRGPRRHIGPAAASPPRGPPRRDHVPRRAARRGGLHRPGAQGLGGGRPQQPHQHLLVQRPPRLPDLDGPRPPVGRLRQRRGRLLDLVAPGVGPLLQPPRPADHGGQGQGGDRHRLRPPPVQHRGQGRPLAADLARHRAVPAAGHRAGAAGAGDLGAGLLPPLGQLGDLPGRGAPRGARRVGVGGAGPGAPLRRLHPRAGRARLRRRRLPDSGDRPDHR